MAFRDPNAPFIARRVIVGNQNGQHIDIRPDNAPDDSPAIKWFTGAATELPEPPSGDPFEGLGPGRIDTSGPGATDALSMQILAPQHVNALPESSYILMATRDPAVFPPPQGRSLIELHAEEINVSSPINYLGSAWVQIPLINSWVDVAGGQAEYMKDAAGNIQIRGIINSGVAVTIATLPIGFRPSQSMEYPLYGGNPGPFTSVVRVTTAGVMSVITNFGGAQARLALNFSFPTL